MWQISPWISVFAFDLVKNGEKQWIQIIIYVPISTDECISVSKDIALAGFYSFDSGAGLPAMKGKDIYGVGVIFCLHRRYLNEVHLGIK